MQIGSFRHEERAIGKFRDNAVRWLASIIDFASVQ